MSRGFPTAEYEARLATLQAQMALQDLGALLLTSEADVRYVSGFLTRFWESPSRPWFLIVPAAGRPVAVIPSIGAALMATTWVQDIRTWRAPDLTDDGVGLLNATLDELLGGQGGRVGLPAGQESHLRMPLGDFWRLQAARPSRSFVGDGNLVRRCRAVKSPAEIQKIESACQVASRAFARLEEVVQIGEPQTAVFRNFQRLCLEEGADFVPYVAGGFGPMGYKDVIASATATPIAAGDVVMLDTGLIVDGYFADFDRNVAVRQPAAKCVQEVHARLIEATAVAFDMAKPGLPVSALFEAMDQVITGGDNSADSGRFGHGLGMQLTEWPSIIPDEHTPLEPGMVLTLEPSMATDQAGHILVHEENIVITETGARALSAFAGPVMNVVG